MQYLEGLIDARNACVDVLDRFGMYGVEWRGSRFETYLRVIDDLVQLAERRKTDPDAYRAFRQVSAAINRNGPHAACAARVDRGSGTAMKPYR